MGRYSDVPSSGRPGGLPRLPGRKKGGRGGTVQKAQTGCLSTSLLPTSTAMSYPVTSQPQCASTCYQTQLSDWHTGLTDCCNDMPVCECPGKAGREGSSPHTPSNSFLSAPLCGAMEGGVSAIFTLPEIPLSKQSSASSLPLQSLLTHPITDPDFFGFSFPSLQLSSWGPHPLCATACALSGEESTGGRGPDHPAPSRSLRHFRSTVPSLPHL